jgi:rod shape determining protein RodA
MIDRRLIKNFDWGLMGLTLVLAALGAAMIYSAVTAGAQTHIKTLYLRQLVWYGVGLMAMLVIFFFNYKLLERWAYGIYVACLVLLVLVLLVGVTGGGSKRWLVFGPLTLQPSEIVKIGVVIVLARYYSSYATTEGFRLRHLVRPMLLTLIPCGLIVVQPDLGTAMMVILIAGGMTFFAKIQRRAMIYIVSAGALVVPLVWFLLKGYQKQRILTFLNPDRDPLGAGYHIIQSKIAIGSGMLTGKGFLKGTQNALAFLPEQHTDFIFSVLAEEWGFMGSAGLLILFLIFIVWALNVANGCREPFGIMLAVGLASMIFWPTVVNIGMVMGLMPVVGVPLPLISYGGSSTVTTMICVGILINVNMRRFTRA